MIRWKINNNVIEELYYDGKNIINPWGFETADSSAFFSLEQGVGWRNKKISETYHYDEKNYKAKVITQMKEGKWELNIDDRIENNVIIRKVEAVTLHDTVFMDFVMRFRFKKEFIKYVEIAGKRYYHRDTNIYYQYKVDQVFLQMNDFSIKITVSESIVPSKMEQVMYVRDSNDEWVIHVRLIPKEADKEVIKICTAWAHTRPLPQQLSKIILSFDSIKSKLWYRGERNPYKNKIIKKFLNLAAFPMVSVSSNEKLLLRSKIDFK